MQDRQIIFPQVTGSNLLRRKLSLPGDFQGEWNLVFIAFQQWQQAQVDSWVPLARELETTVPGLRFYELPTIWEMNILSRTLLNEGMRAGIPNPATREKTITLYLDKPAFRRALDIHDEGNIHVLLLDPQDRVAWRTVGAFTPEAGADLVRALKEQVAGAAVAGE